MKWRWMAAAGASLALAFLTFPVFPAEMLSATSWSVADAVDEAACDPDARPANLDFTLQDMHGDDVDLASYRGKVILFNFWRLGVVPVRLRFPVLLSCRTSMETRVLLCLDYLSTIRSRS